MHYFHSKPGSFFGAGPGPVAVSAQGLGDRYSIGFV